MTYRLPPHLAAIADQHLTPQQRTVLELWSRGLGRDRIALILDLSPSTVRNHHQRAMQIMARHINPKELERLRKDAA